MTEMGSLLGQEKMKRWEWFKVLVQAHSICPALTKHSPICSNQLHKLGCLQLGSS